MQMSKGPIYSYSDLRRVRLKELWESYVYNSQERFIEGMEECVVMM